MFSPEVIVSGGVVLNCIVWRDGVRNDWPSHFTNRRRKELG